MLRKKLKIIIKRALLGLMLATTISTGLFSVKAYAKEISQPYVLSEASINYKEQESNSSIIYYNQDNLSAKKILIYNTHTNEAYKDGRTVHDAAFNLAEKLYNKGFTVEVVNEQFDNYDYNNSYKHSKSFLENMDLDAYNLVIDLHRDSAEGKVLTGTDINSNSTSRICLVYSKSSGNYESQTAIGNTIEDNMKQFGEGLVRNTVAYNKGRDNFNQQLSDNIVLIEVGFENDEFVEVQRSLTFLAASIDLAINK